MSSFGELIGRVSPGLRDLGATMKVILDEPADRFRADARRKVGEEVSKTEEGQKIKTEYIKGKLAEYAPMLIIAVVGGLLVILLSRRT